MECAVSIFDEIVNGDCSGGQNLDELSYRYGLQVFHVRIHIRQTPQNRVFINKTLFAFADLFILVRFHPVSQECLGVFFYIPSWNSIVSRFENRGIINLHKMLDGSLSLGPAVGVDGVFLGVFDIVGTVFFIAGLFIIGLRFCFCFWSCSRFLFIDFFFCSSFFSFSFFIVLNNMRFVSNTLFAAVFM